MLKKTLLMMSAMVFALACTPEDEEPSTAVSSAPTVAAAQKGPALWKVSDEDTTIYMFGTVHVLPPELTWRTPLFEAVLSEADTWYFESDAAKPEDRDLQAKINAWGMQKPGESLFDDLTPAERTDLVAASEAVGIPGGRMALLKPWFAAIVLSFQHIMAQGQSPESGVENILIPEGRMNGKSLRFFETAEDQMRVLAELPEKVQIEFLMEGVRQVDEIPDFVQRMDDAWSTGELEELEAIVLADQSVNTPEVYEALLLKRNLAWAAELKQLAEDEAGVYLVAVGAAHLLGPDSVVTMLEQYGLDQERLQ